MEPPAGLFPALLRHWRTRRGMSQLDLASAADVSSRHISFLETGRSAPGVDMVVRLATTLDVPLRQVNALLRAAGHEPRYADAAEGALPTAVQSALDLMKAHHDPYPLVVMDRSYRMLDANQGASALLGAVFADLGPIELTDLNLARLTVDPELGGRLVVNHDAMARDLLWRMQRELLADPDNDGLRELLDELLATPGLPSDWRRADPTAPSAPTLDLQLRVGSETWSFLLVVSALLAPLEVMLEELRIEQWFPADDLTAAGCAALLG
ncbi:XRE family transcriptional regulator [Nocardioides marmoriginsengisoli]|uniref:XRE family transcriptional regulator n=1 Tax=Nocardioides marmoriginsengisoli TaxID=661483 RepID=A0A3N0CC46_9ACTN|nr:XRE family transcriptional regulator [Nocardioides marmoriginsengisoli]